MRRHWLFTWRTFGTWLPGQVGFVGNYVNDRGWRVSDNAHGDTAGPAMPALAAWAADQQRGPSIYLDTGQAEVVADQLRETARYRGRLLDAVVVMPDHVHVVFAVTGDPTPDALLADWKRYASRALNRTCDARTDWWARDGSTRPLKTPLSRARAIRYVRNQEEPLLLVWVSPIARAFAATVLGLGDRTAPSAVQGEPRV